MLKKMTVAAMVGAFSLASLPVLTSTVFAQGTEPPSAPSPSDAKGGSMSKDGGMSKDNGMMKKSSDGMMKKKMKKKHKKM